MAIPMHVARILIREMADMQIIELTEVGGERSFPIVIGLPALAWLLALSGSGPS